MDLSIVAPLYNEEDSVQPLYEAIAAVLDQLPGASEIVFVDDGSKDGTFDRAANLASRDKRLRVVKFRKNYGQTPAMAAGIDVARGKTIITMDGDLQNDPKDIPEFLKKIDEGYDLVVGWRRNRQDKLITRKIPSKIANWLIGKVTGVPIRDNGCSLKAFRASVIKQVPLYNEMHRFIPAMSSIAGTSIAEIPVHHHARKFGSSKYGLSRVYKVLFDLLTIKTIVGFASRPLRWFGMIAIPFSIFSCGLLVAGLIALSLSASSAVVLTGCGLFFASLSVFLIFGGVLAELVNLTGDRDLALLPGLTARELGRTHSETDSRMEI